jgi:hypothetical protein
MPDRTFECPVAKKTVTFSTRSRDVGRGLPPTPPEFVGCTGLSTCGVRTEHADGWEFNWNICPGKRSMI